MYFIKFMLIFRKIIAIGKELSYNVIVDCVKNSHAEFIGKRRI